jgi:hypothetical protein
MFQRTRIPAFAIAFDELNPAFADSLSKVPDSFSTSELFTKIFLIMRKKSGFTIVEQAIVLVPEFEKVVRKLEQQVTLRGQSTSTLNNYIRRIALFVVHFEKLPEQIDPEEFFLPPRSISSADLINLRTLRQNASGRSMH